MPKILGGPVGPDGAGGAYHNTAADDRAALWAALGGQAGFLAGGTVTGRAGEMALDVPPLRALVAERDAAGTPLARGYYAYSDDTKTVLFDAPSAQQRVDAVVLAVADTSAGAGAFGTGVTEAGPQLLVVTGVSGVTTPRSDADIQAWVGAGGWLRLADVPVAPGDTEINAANITATATDVWRPVIKTGTKVVTPPDASRQTTHVTFPSPFAAAPRVHCNPQVSGPDVTFVSAYNITATGFDLAYVRTAFFGSAFTIGWTAILTPGG